MRAAENMHLTKWQTVCAKESRCLSYSVKIYHETQVFVMSNHQQFNCRDVESTMTISGEMP